MAKGKNLRDYIKLIHNAAPSAATEIDRDQYNRDFEVNVSKSSSIAEAAFKKAWEVRNFEIEMYWRRATYFWAFIASTFAAYFLLISRTETIDPQNSYLPEEIFIVVCIGFVLSCAWLFTNRGSKTWQRHWEVHVDLLENNHTGPLYQTVNHNHTYSVSKINEIVSFVFVLMWLLLGLKFLFDYRLINFAFGNVRWTLVVASLITVIAVYSMQFGYGRGRFGHRTVKMYRRAFRFD